MLLRTIAATYWRREHLPMIGVERGLPALFSLVVILCQVGIAGESESMSISEVRQVDPETNRLLVQGYKRTDGGRNVHFGTWISNLGERRLVSFYDSDGNALPVELLLALNGMPLGVDVSGKNGHKTSVSYYASDAGVVKSIVQTDNGRVHGAHNLFNPDATILLSRVYQAGRLVSALKGAESPGVGEGTRGRFVQYTLDVTLTGVIEMVLPEGYDESARRIREDYKMGICVRSTTWGILAGKGEDAVMNEYVYDGEGRLITGSDFTRGFRSTMKPDGSLTVERIPSP